MTYENRCGRLTIRQNDNPPRVDIADSGSLIGPPGSMHNLEPSDLHDLIYLCERALKAAEGKN